MKFASKIVGFFPKEGEFELTVIGTGTYDIDILASSRDLTYSSLNDIRGVSISPGEIHTYVLDYSREPNVPIELTDVFHGKGQRPKDINRILSYLAPTSSSTNVSISESTYTLTLLFGKTLIPDSFVADLNGVDITNLFSPSPGNIEYVTINLNRGRNVHRLSIDGISDSERTVTDNDRLVFLVE